MTLFKDKNGKISSKRIFAGLMVLSGIVGHFLKLDSGTNMSLIIAGGTVLGFSVWEKKE